MALPISGYELTLCQTVDDLELFVWWQETRLVPGNRWARLVREDLAVQLFDRGIRSVAAVAAQGGTGPVLAELVPVQDWRAQIIWAAHQWAPLPREWREDAMRRYGLVETLR